MHPRTLLLPALAIVAIAFAGSPGCTKATTPTYGGTVATGPSFSLSFPAQGASQSLTFTDIGSWDYHCNPHGPAMAGTVVVSASASTDTDTVAVGVNASGVAALVFTPATVTIKPGGHVRWINRSSMVNHTVTRP